VLIKALHRLTRTDAVCVLVGSYAGREAYRRELESLAGSLGVTARLRLVGDLPRHARGLHAGRRRGLGLDRPRGVRPGCGRGLGDGPADGRDRPRRLAREPWSTRPPASWCRPAIRSRSPKRSSTWLGLTPAERLALGGRARAFAEQRYSKARMCAATLEVYAELLGDSGAAQGTNPGPERVSSRILVIKLGALGDIVQALGPFAAIRRHHADDEITLLTTLPFAEFLKRSPYFDQVWVDPRASWRRVDAVAGAAPALGGRRFRARL